MEKKIYFRSFETNVSCSPKILLVFHDYRNDKKVCCILHVTESCQKSMYSMAYKFDPRRYPLGQLIYYCHLSHGMHCFKLFKLSTAGKLSYYEIGFRHAQADIILIYQLCSGKVMALKMKKKRIHFLQ